MLSFSTWFHLHRYSSNNHKQVPPSSFFIWIRDGMFLHSLTQGLRIKFPQNVGFVVGKKNFFIFPIWVLYSSLKKVLEHSRYHDDNDFFLNKTLLMEIISISCVVMYDPQVVKVFASLLEEISKQIGGLSSQNTELHVFLRNILKVWICHIEIEMKMSSLAGHSDFCCCVFARWWSRPWSLSLAVCVMSVPSKSLSPLIAFALYPLASSES